jgi:hypothetical protein
MPFRELWAKRIAATVGCLALLACSLASAWVLIPRSWRDLDDATTRMRIFRFHVYDADFIWSAIAFASVVLTVAAMFLCCLWAFWMLARCWTTPPTGGPGPRGASKP